MMKMAPLLRSRLLISALLALHLLGACEASPSGKTPANGTSSKDEAAIAEADFNRQSGAHRMLGDEDGSRTITEIAQYPKKRLGADVFFCGGQTTQAAVNLYFANLKSALSEAGPNGRFSRFVREKFGIRSAQGKTHWFDLADFNSITPSRITREEWLEISARGPDKLEGAGWRGCFLDHGKVWFEATEENGLKLMLVAKDMPWVEPGSK